jgi:hypothetical protein
MDLSTRALKRVIIPLLLWFFLSWLGLDRLLVGVVVGYLAWMIDWGTPDDGIRADPVLALAEREPDENNPRRYEPLRPS